jgi:hypothetical protein
MLGGLCLRLPKIPQDISTVPNGDSGEEVTSRFVVTCADLARPVDTAGRREYGKEKPVFLGTNGATPSPLQSRCPIGHLWVRHLNFCRKAWVSTNLDRDGFFQFLVPACLVPLSGVPHHGCRHDYYRLDIQGGHAHCPHRDRRGLCDPVHPAPRCHGSG